MKFTLSSQGYTAEIVRKGAELTSVKNSAGLEYIWQAGEAWPRHAPLLFPIVGRLKDDKYTHEGKVYSLTQHGFARDMDFSLVKQTANSCVLELTANEKTLACYPFDFTLAVRFELRQNTLSCMCEVRNNGKGEMFFSIGAHPGFRCPLEQGMSYSDYYIEMEKRSFLQTVLKGGLRSKETRLLPLEGKNLRLTDRLFDEDALVFENGQVHSATLRSDNGKHSVSLRCADAPYLGIWAKKGCTDFVCLEPWQGIADPLEGSGELRDKEGIHKLRPLETYNWGFQLIFA